VVPVRNISPQKHPPSSHRNPSLSHFPLSLLFLLRPDSIYKIPDGKPENQFAFSGEAKNKKYATAIIHECHEAWRRLIGSEAIAKTPNYEISMYALFTFFGFTAG
jgi:hypothetical protein